MLSDVITPFTTEPEWLAQRSRLRRAFLDSLGTFPESLSYLVGSDGAGRATDRTTAAKGSRPSVRSEETARTIDGDLTRVELRYHVIGDYWTDVVILAPPGFDRPDAPPRPVVLTIHGTNRERGKYSLMDPAGRPNRAYASELAGRGFIAVAPDQFGFGPDSRELGQEALFERFYADFPEWSLDGMRLASHMRLIDLLASRELSSAGPQDDDGGQGAAAGIDGPTERAGRDQALLRVGAIGNSLGGRAVIHLAAVDERVAAAVVSTGISPNYSNVYRHIKRPGQLKSPRLTEKLAADGISPWDYQHLIALCAPRNLLIIEPWNDPYNPDTAGAMDCTAKAAAVYRLLDRPEALRLLVHGDGHDTTERTRSYAYDFLADGVAP